jgi:hypothetical protein
MSRALGDLELFAFQRRSNLIPKTVIY